jgi:hypothetical protein
MEYSHRYPAYPTQQVAVELERHIDIHRQAYNYHYFWGLIRHADCSG